MAYANRGLRARALWREIDDEAGVGGREWGLWLEMDGGGGGGRNGGQERVEEREILEFGVRVGGRLRVWRGVMGHMLGDCVKEGGGRVMGGVGGVRG